MYWFGELLLCITDSQRSGSKWREYAASAKFKIGLVFLQSWCTFMYCSKYLTRKSWTQYGAEFSSSFIYLFIFGLSYWFSDQLHVHSSRTAKFTSQSCHVISYFYLLTSNFQGEESAASEGWGDIRIGGTGKFDIVCQLESVDWSSIL